MPVTEGIVKLCESLKNSSITSLECGRSRTVTFCLSVVQRPMTFSTQPANTLCLSLHSLAENYLTDCGKDTSGVLKLAEMLPQTKIESLKCAPFTSRTRSVHCPLTWCFLCTHSIAENYLGVEGIKPIAAVLKDTQITNLKCAPALKPKNVLAFMSAPLDVCPLLGL